MRNSENSWEKTLPRNFPRKLANESIVHLILECYLQYDFVQTSYSINSYVVPGIKADNLLRGKTTVAMDFEDSKESNGKKKKVIRHYYVIVTSSDQVQGSGTREADRTSQEAS